MTATTITATTSAATPRAPRVFLANVRAEWTKLRSVRSTVWTLLTTVGLAVGFGALIGAPQMSSWDNLDPNERLRFDPTSFSLSGLFLAQLAVGVLGVLVITSEYATGQIRATFSATPQRLTVLAAKAATFTAVVLGTGLVASFSDPGVLRAVSGWRALPRRRPRHDPAPHRRRRRRTRRPPLRPSDRHRLPALLVPRVDREVLPRSSRHGHLQRRPRR
jgi:hypothetical protein